MAFVNTGLQIEIKGIKQALQELAELDQRQDNLSLSADALIQNLNGMQTAFTTLKSKAQTISGVFDRINITVFASGVQQADRNLEGFSSSVQATVPHLQNIAKASQELSKDKLASLSNVKVDSQNLQQASTAIDLLAARFQELTTILNSGGLNTLQQFAAIFSQTDTNARQFGADINQLALGLQKLAAVKDIETIRTNFNNFLSVLRRLRDIEFTGTLSEIDRIGPAIRNVGAGLKDFSETTAGLDTKSISSLFTVLRQFNDINIAGLGIAMPTFANSLNQLAEAFRRFSAGEPGEKLPASLKAVTDALKVLISTFNQSGNTTVDIQQLGASMASIAPSIEQFANAMRKFTTGKGIADLPQRMKDIREAFIDIRDAFNFKDIDVLAPKIQALAPALKELATAFRAFTSGTNIKNLSAQISTIITALREFTRIDLGDISSDIGSLAPAIKALAEGFRAFTTGTNIGDLPKRIQNIVDAITELKSLNLTGFGKSLGETAEPISKFFNAFRLFSGSEKFDNLGKRFAELAKSLQQLKKLNLGQFSKELQGVSTGLSSLIKASELVNSKNIDKLAVTFAQVRKEAQANTVFNRALAVSYNILARPILVVVNGIRSLAVAIVKLPINVFLGQLRLLKAILIDLPIGVVTTAFSAFMKVLRLFQALFSQIVIRINQAQKIFNDIAVVVKLLLLPFTALIKVFQSLINISSKIATIFTAFKVKEVSADVQKLNANLTQTNQQFERTAQTASKADTELTGVDRQYEEVGRSSQQAQSGINGANIALKAINVAQVAALGLGIAGATKKILAFAAAAKSLEVINNVFQRLSITVQTFGRNVVGGAFEATATFEQLQLQIESLLAKEFTQLGKAGSVQEALGMQELNDTFNETLAVIKKLAIESPFDNTDVIRTFQMAQSFGFVREEALNMTRILVDASSALGLSGADAADIAKVFGQIKSLGKVLAGDVNQLAQRGINVKTILKENGLTLEEVQKGALDADQAIQLILNTLERDFGGSAARATNTLEGLRSTIISLKDDILRISFTPLFDALKPFAAQVTGLFQTDTFIAQLEQFGNVLRDNVLGSILAVAKPIVFLVTTFLNLPEPVQQAIFFMARFAVTALAVSSAVAVIQAGLIVFGTALSFIFNPISLTIGAVITLTTTLIAGRKVIGDFANFIGTSLTEKLNTFGNTFPTIGKYLDSFGNKINAVTTRIRNAFDAVAGVVTGFFGVVNTPVAVTGLSTVPTYLDSITLAFNNTTSEVKDFGTTFGATGKTVEANVGTIADKFVAFEQTAGLALEKIKTPFDDFLIVLDNFAKSTADKILFVNDKINLFGDFIGRLFTYISTAVQPAVDSFNAAFTSFGTAFEGVTTLISNTFNGITTSVSNELGALGTFIGDKLNSLGNFFTNFLTDTTDFGGGLVGAFAEGILATINVVADALLEIAKVVTFWLEPGSPPRILPEIDKWGEGLILAWIDGMANGIQQAFGTLGPIIQKAAQGTFTVLSAIGNFTFGTIINSLVLFGGIFQNVFLAMVAIGRTFLTQIVLVFNFIANSFTIALNPALSFKDKFIQILNELGYFVSGTFVNVAGLVISFGDNIISTFIRIGQFITNEFVLAFESLKLIFPKLDSLTSKIAEFANKSLNNLEKFGNSASKFFADLLNSVTEYGNGLISAFSDGIIASVGVVVDALSYLGDTISYWLAPGSPPRLLPEIDKWGQSAADEFLGGFTTADFDKIEDFGNTVEKVIKNLELGEGVDIDFQGISQDFAEALASGEISDSTFADLRAQAPQAANEITKLAASYFEINKASTELEQANNKVAESQAKVAEETEKIRSETEAYDAQISELEAKLSGIETASTYDAEIKQIQQLQEVINSRYSSEYEQKQAQRKIDEIRTQQQLRQLKAEKAANEVNLRAAEEQLKADEEAAKRKEENVSATQEELDALKARLALADKFNQGSQDGLGGADGSAVDADGKAKGAKLKKLKAEDLVEPINFDDILSGFGDPGSVISGALDNVKNAFDTFKERLSTIKKNLDDFFTNLKYRFGQLQETFKPVTDALGELLNNTNLIKGAFIALGVVLAGPTILGALGSIATIFGTIIAVLSPLSGVLLGATVLFGGLGFAAYILGKNVLQATGLFGENSKLLDEVIANLGIVIGKIQTISSNFASGFLTGLFTDQQGFLDAVLGFDTTDLSTISTSLGNIAAEIAQAFAQFQLIVFKSFTGILLGKNPIDTFLTEITGKDYTGTFQKFATKVGNDIYDAVKYSVDTFKANIASSGLAAGITTSIVQLLGEAFSAIGSAIGGIANFDLSTIQFNIGGMTLTGGPELGSKLATLLGESFSFLENVNFSTPKTVITSIFTKTFESIKSTVGSQFTLFIQNVFGEQSSAIFAKLSEVLGVITNAFNQLAINLQTNGLAESFQNLITQIIYASTEILKLAGPIIGALGGAIAVLTVAFIPQIADVLKLIVDTVADVIQNIGDVARIIREFVTGQRSFKDTITGIFSEILQTVGTIFSSFDKLGDIIATTIKDAITIIGGLIGIDVQPFLDKFGWIIDIVGDLIATGLAGWIGLIGKSFSILRGTIGLILKPFKLLFDAINFLITKYKALTAVINTVKTFFGILGNIVTKVANIFTTQNPLFNAIGKTFNFITIQAVKVINALGGMPNIFGLIRTAIAGFINFALSSFTNFNIAITSAIGFAVVLKNGIGDSIKFIVDKFTQLRDFLFGSDGLISKISAIGTTVTDPFASLVITNPFAFIDEFLPVFKIAIEGVPTYFTGLLDNVVVFNPFEALNTFLFSEGGFTSKVLGIGSNFVTTASEITGINIPDPFLLIKTTLDNIEKVGPLAKGSIVVLSDAIKELTVNDVFEAISKSLAALLQGAQDLLKLDLSGFSKVFAPVTEAIDGIKEKFDGLIKKFQETASIIPGINLGESELTGVEIAQQKIKTEFGGEPVTVDQKLDLLLEDPELSSKAKGILDTFKASYDENTGTFATDFAAINKDLIEAGFTAEDIINVAKAAGLDVQEGFAEGFTSDTTATTREARQLATNTLKELQAALGIKSPSTKARDEVGLYVVQGVLEAFKDTELIAPAVETLVNNIISQLASQINSASSQIQTNITSALMPSFNTAATELSTGFVQKASTELSNADIPVVLKTDYQAEGEKYGSQLGLGFVTGLDNQLSQTTGIQGIAILFSNTLNTIKSSITGFTTGVTTIFNTFYTAVTNAANKFLTALVKLWADKFKALMEDVIEPFVEDFTDLVEEFYELLLDLTEELFDGVISELDAFILSATNKYSTFVNNLVTLTRTAINGIINEFKRLTTELVPIIEQAIRDAEAAMQKIVDRFTKIGTDAVDGFIDELDKLFERTEESLETFLSQLDGKYLGVNGELYKKGYTYGRDFMDGWITGVESKRGELLEKIKSIVKDFLDNVAGLLGIQSPSKVMYGLALHTMDGFILGIQNRFNALRNTMKTVTSIVTNGISSDIKLTGTRSQNLILDYANQPMPVYNKGYQRVMSSNVINSGSNYNISNNYNMTVNTKPDKAPNVRRQFKTMEFIGV